MTAPAHNNQNAAPGKLELLMLAAQVSTIATVVLFAVSLFA
jgi:hypothetical protein